MRVALPKEVWEKLDKKTQKEIKKIVCKEEGNSYGYLPILTAYPFYRIVEHNELYIIDENYRNIDDRIKEVVYYNGLEKKAKDYDKLSSSIGNIKELLK